MVAATFVRDRLLHFNVARVGLNSTTIQSTHNNCCRLVHVILPLASSATATARNGIASWDTTLNSGAGDWDATQPPDSFGGAGGNLQALAAFSGYLYAGGGNMGGGFLYRWDMSSTPGTWDVVGDGVNNNVHALTAVGSAALLVGGVFTASQGASAWTNQLASCAVWDGSVLQQCDQGFNAGVYAVAALPLQTGKAILAGAFKNVAGVPTTTAVNPFGNLAIYDTATNTTSPAGCLGDIVGIGKEVRAVAPSSTQANYFLAGGSFTTAYCSDVGACGMGGVAGVDLAATAPQPTRTPVPGPWVVSRLGAGLKKQAYSVMRASYDGSIIVGYDSSMGTDPDLTSFEGVTLRHVARYSPSTGLWTAMGGGLNTQPVVVIDWGTCGILAGEHRHADGFTKLEF